MMAHAVRSKPACRVRRTARARCDRIYPAQWKSPRCAPGESAPRPREPLRELQRPGLVLVLAVRNSSIALQRPATPVPTRQQADRDPGPKSLRHWITNEWEHQMVWTSVVRRGKYK